MPRGRTWGCEPSAPNLKIRTCFSPMAAMCVPSWEFGLAYAVGGGCVEIVDVGAELEHLPAVDIVLVEGAENPALKPGERDAVSREGIHFDVENRGGRRVVVARQSRAQRLFAHGVQVT